MGPVRAGWTGSSRPPTATSVALERSEPKLQATRAEYAGDVRDLYARGPLAPLELLLAAGTVRARVAELGVTQADTLALREGLAGQEAAIGRLLAERKAMLATARAKVRA